MYDKDQDEKRLLHEIGLDINWNNITNEEWQRMLNRNEQSKRLEQIDKQLNNEE